MSSQRSLIRRIERKLEATFDDAFARIFGGSVVPEEVEALLRHEAEDALRPLHGNRFLAPNEYVITLGVHDFEKVRADPGLTSRAFARYLADYIEEQGWQTYGEVVVRFEETSSLHTGQFRARGTVNPDAKPRPTVDDAARPHSNHAFGAERGVAMTDNSSYRADQGQERPAADDYYDDRYGRPRDDSRSDPDRPGESDQRGGHPPEQGGYPPPGGYAPPRRPDQGGGYPQQGGGYPQQGGYPDQGGGYPQQGGGYPKHGGGHPQQGGGYPEQGGGYPQQGGGYPGSYEQRPPVAGGYGAQGYDQGFRPGGGYGPPGGAPQGFAGGYGDYGRGPARGDEGGYGGPPRPDYPDQGGGYDRGYQQSGPGYGRQDYGPGGEYTQYAESVPVGGYPPQGGYAETAHRDYDYGQSGDYGAQPDYAQPAEYGDYGQQAGGYGGYGPGGYGSAGTTVTLHLDDGSGRTYQLREGSNIVGRGQDAQFRLPDTGVSRRHLEIRWDGQVALLADLNSTNGTTVNNAPVQEWQLADGDVIRLGHSEIIVRIQ